ncbi:MAG: hypothetical protein IPO56_16705 [Flavobacteriales bacterium]|nr:hypothetical protein [Flavobacteriales bacterium]
MLHRFMLRAILLLACVAATIGVSAQNVGINADGAVPHISAMLDVDASALPANGKKGL